MEDLISMSEAVKSINNILELNNYYHPYSKSKQVPINEVVDRLNGLPSIELSTNLASLGTDCISRQAVIDAFYLYPNINWTTLDVLKKINEMPTIQPEIVRCKDCKNYKFGMCIYSMTSGVGKLPNGFCDWGERREVTT